MYDIGKCRHSKKGRLDCDWTEADMRFKSRSFGTEGILRDQHSKPRSATLGSCTNRTPIFVGLPGQQSSDGIEFTQNEIKKILGPRGDDRAEDSKKWGKVIRAANIKAE